MIPLRDQEVIRQRFDQELAARVRIDYFTQRQTSIIIPGRQDCVHCEDVRVMMEEIAHLSTRISLSVHQLAGEPKLAAELGIDKVPGIAIRGVANRTLRFAGIPAGAQFPGFIDTIIDCARTQVALKPETVRQLRKLKQDISVQVFVVPNCPHSPAAARLALKLGLQSPRVKTEIVEIVEFPAVVQRLGIAATPTTLIDGRLLLPGLLDEAALVQAIARVAEGKVIASADIQQGPATPFQPAQGQQRQPREAMTAGGIILPH